MIVHWHSLGSIEIIISGFNCTPKTFLSITRFGQYTMYHLTGPTAMMIFLLNKYMPEWTNISDGTLAVCPGWCVDPQTDAIIRRMFAEEPLSE